MWLAILPVVPPDRTNKQKNSFLPSFDSIFFLALQGPFILVQTKQVTMKPDDVTRVFQCQDYTSAAEQGGVCFVDIINEPEYLQAWIKAIE